MASTSFMSENQSFSEANSSWASLIVDQVQSTLEDEEYSNIPDFYSNGGDHSTPAKRPGGSRQHVDMRTFEQILQVMIQQGAALDRLREELDQYRQECRQELDNRDVRLRLAEKELRSLRTDKEAALSELQELEEELGELKALEEPTSSQVINKEEHDRIVRRVKDDARARIENSEAEKARLTVQLSRFQIQVAQLKNQLDDRSYPDEVIEELTKTLKYNIIETCKNADVEAQAVKQELAAIRGELSKRDGEIALATHAREEAESEVEELRGTLEELHNEYDAVQERLAIAESMQGQAEANEISLREAEGQVEQLRVQLSEIENTRDAALLDCDKLRALLKDAEERQAPLMSELKSVTEVSAQMRERLSELQKQHDAVESDLRKLLEDAEMKLKAVTQELQTQIDTLNDSLENAKAETAKEINIRKALEESVEEEKTKHLEEKRKLESELEVAKKQIADLEATAKNEQMEARAAQKKIDELQEALKQAEIAHKGAVRENEQIRLKHAEAESSRAEADMMNEELQQRVTQLEVETKKVKTLESELKSTQGQLAQVTESISLAEDQASKQDSAETSQLRVEIAELREENEQLVTARRQMAAIYGLSTERITSPRHTPTRMTPTSPVRRSSQSLSPTTSSGPLQWLGYPLPPPKRRRTSKRTTAGSGLSGVAAPGSSPASAILLEETDDGMTAPPSTPTSKEQSGFYADFPRHLIDIYAVFTKVVTWTDESDRPACGFCIMHNHNNDNDNRRAPLQFNPSQYPITFWNHCLMRHKDALRPDIEAWLKAEGQELAASDPFQSGDDLIVLPKFISWKRADEDKYVCGLCEMEKGKTPRAPLDSDPINIPHIFWMHCRTEHAPFLKPDLKPVS